MDLVTLQSLEGYGLLSVEILFMGIDRLNTVLNILDRLFKRPL